jgi:cellulose biosynthesis protein BcsQ
MSRQLKELIDLQMPNLINLSQNQPSTTSSSSFDRNSRRKSAKIICFYAEKGGVGKTTTCIALAHTFAKDGHRVLVYDCDVQRSLTSWAFGINIELNHSHQVNKLDNFIKTLPSNGMPKSLYEQVNDSGRIRPAFAACNNFGVYIVAGDRRTPELDTTILRIETLCEELKGAVPNNKSARSFYSIMATAKYYDADYVFLDLNPYPSTLNRCLIMSSHYILVPVCLDSFCLEMIHNMESNLCEWKRRIDAIRKCTDHAENNMCWPKHSPKFLGYVRNIFTVYKEGMMRRNEMYWAEQIELEAKKITVKLGDNRRNSPLAITQMQYLDSETSPCLGEITEFHGLGDISNIFHLPVPCLSEKHFYRYKIDSKGNETGKFRKISPSEMVIKRGQLDRFIERYSSLQERVIRLINFDQKNSSMEWAASDSEDGEQSFF